MPFPIRQEGNATVVSVVGRLDGVTGPEFQKTVRQVIADGSNRVVADLQELHYISSAGISEILVSTKLVKESGGQMRLANVHGNVESVFKMCGVVKMLQIHPSVAEAVAALA